MNTTTGWLASFNTFKLSKKWSIHLDVQWRSTDDVEQLQTFLFRPGINYHVKKNQVATAGYAFIPNRYTVPQESEMLAEHRLWQQYIFIQPVANTSIQHRLRFEERFVPRPLFENGDLKADDYLFSTRFRYFTRSIIPLAKQQKAFEKGWFTALQNEIFLNTTHLDHVNGQVFDQNRLYAAFGRRIAKGFDVEAGYMWQYVNRKEGVPDISNHIAQLVFYWRR